jgi:hypothetical protein
MGNMPPGPFSVVTATDYDHQNAHLNALLVEYYASVVHHRVSISPYLRLERMHRRRTARPGNSILGEGVRVTHPGCPEQRSPDSPVRRAIACNGVQRRASYPLRTLTVKPFVNISVSFSVHTPVRCTSTIQPTGSRLPAPSKISKLYFPGSK